MSAIWKQCTDQKCAYFLYFYNGITSLKFVYSKTYKDIPRDIHSMGQCPHNKDQKEIQVHLTAKEDFEGATYEEDEQTQYPTCTSSPADVRAFFYLSTREGKDKNLSLEYGKTTDGKESAKVTIPDIDIMWNTDIVRTIKGVSLTFVK